MLLHCIGRSVGTGPARLYVNFKNFILSAEIVMTAFTKTAPRLSNGRSLITTFRTTLVVVLLALTSVLLLQACVLVRPRWRR